MIVFCCFSVRPGPAVGLAVNYQSNGVLSGRHLKFLRLLLLFKLDYKIYTHNSAWYILQFPAYRDIAMNRIFRFFSQNSVRHRSFTQPFESFQLWLQNSRIQNQNRKGSKGCVRDLCRTELCQKSKIRLIAIPL
jgi:hypothetical protein